MHNNESMPQSMQTHPDVVLVVVLLHNLKYSAHQWMNLAMGHCKLKWVLTNLQQQATGPLFRYIPKQWCMKREKLYVWSGSAIDKKWATVWQHHTYGINLATWSTREPICHTGRHWHYKSDYKHPARGHYFTIIADIDDFHQQHAVCPQCSKLISIISRWYALL